MMMLWGRLRNWTGNENIMRIRLLIFFMCMFVMVVCISACVCVCVLRLAVFFLSVPNHVFPELEISYLNTARLKPLTRWLARACSEFRSNADSLYSNTPTPDVWKVLNNNKSCSNSLERKSGFTRTAEVGWVLQRTLLKSVQHSHKFRTCISAL